MNNTSRLQGKVALVTGGGSGIGRATAILFAKEKAKVIVSDINLESAKETLEIIKSNSGEAHAIQVDVTSSKSVNNLIEQIIKMYGRLDCAFNNAGVGGSKVPVAECSDEDWGRIININLTSVFYCMKYEIRQMLKQPTGGSIINTSSIFGLVTGVNNVDYTASKHGVIGLTRSAAVDYAKQNIRVNAICPGFIRTPILKPLLENPELEARVTARHPIGRLGNPEEIAETVIWLASDAASFITGANISVDGGYVAQ